MNVYSGIALIRHSSISALEGGSPRTGSFAIYKLQGVYWFHDFRLGYLDLTESIQLL
jgi:hypothetical protein